MTNTNATTVTATLSDSATVLVVTDTTLSLYGMGRADYLDALHTDALRWSLDGAAGAILDLHYRDVDVATARTAGRWFETALADRSYSEACALIACAETAPLSCDAADACTVGGAL